MPNTCLCMQAAPCMQHALQEITTFLQMQDLRALSHTMCVMWNQEARVLVVMSHYALCLALPPTHMAWLPSSQAVADSYKVFQHSRLTDAGGTPAGVLNKDWTVVPSDPALKAPCCTSCKIRRCCVRIWRTQKERARKAEHKAQGS